MTPTTLRSARVLRDGGIDAVAALNEALKEVLIDSLPSDQREIKQEFGRVITTILDATISPAIRAFPELDPDEATWLDVVKSRAASRAAQ